MHPNSPIGILDSGCGGLTVFLALRQVLPLENILYFGDTAHLPYGNKSKETILRYVRNNTAYLQALGIKILVIACNTACALTLDQIRNELSIPVVGIIEQGVSEVLRLSKIGSTAIIATRATIASKIYEEKILKEKPHAHLEMIACPLFVSLVEEGFTDHPLTHLAIHEYLAPLKQKPIDTLLLGCTHYPLLKPALQKALGSEILLIDPAIACAEQIQSILEASHLLRIEQSSPYNTFYVTDHPEHFQKVAEIFLGQPLQTQPLMCTSH